MGTTSSTSSSVFTGSSAFSSDLQSTITRAVNIASLPIEQLSNEQSALAGQKNALQGLSTQFQNLQTALDAINTASGTGSYFAGVDNTSVASAAVSSGVMAGSYALTVGSIGAHTNTMSSGGLTVVNPSTSNISHSSTFTLSVNGTPYQITDSDASLNGLAQAINGSSAGVQATIVNVGSPTSPDYRLSIQGTNYAPDSIQLNDGTNDLLNTLSTGSYVTYQINGQPSTPIQSTSRSVNLSPGLTVDVLQAGSASITVTQNVGGVSSALSSFATAYNSVVDALTAQRGQNAGALSGQSIVYQLQSSLRSLANYSGSSGTVNSLADLGLTFDQNGHLQFDSTTFNSAANSSQANVLNFIGSETGGGFLQAAQTILTSVDDTTNGMLPQATTSLGTQLTDIASQITTQQNKVTLLQTSLTNQMSAADATISSMEQQVTQITNLFSAMQQYNKNGN